MPATKPAAKKRAPRIAARRGVELLTRVDYLRAQMLLLERVMGKSDPGSIAYIQAAKSQLDVRDRLDKALEKGSGNPWAGLSEDEIRDKLRTEGDSMPDAHLAILVEVYCERHRLPFPMLAVSGGR